MGVGMARAGALALALGMLWQPETVTGAAQRACSLWARTVMPGLFPFLVCLLYAAGRQTPRSGPMGRLTGLSRGGRQVLGMGLITGSPGGARLMGEAAARGLLCPREGVRLAVYGGSMSPMFLMGTLPLWLGLGSLGPRLLAAHWLGVICAGEFSRLFPWGPCPRTGEKPPEAMTLPRAIEAACRAMLTVCGCMVMGAVATALGGKLLPGLGAVGTAVFQCLMEVTCGLESLIRLGAPLWMLPGAVSLGGLSLFLQNLAFWPRGWFHPGWVLMGRLLAAGFSLLWGRLLLWRLPAPAFAFSPPPLPEPGPWLWGFVLLCALPLWHQKAQPSH